MFDKFKQLKELHDLKKSMEQQTVEVQKHGIRVVVRGDMKIQEITLNPDLPAAQQGALARDVVNEAIEKLQRAVAASFLSKQ